VIILGILFHYILPQLRKQLPWLLFSEPLIKQADYKLFEPSGRICCRRARNSRTCVYVHISLSRSDTCPMDREMLSLDCVCREEYSSAMHISRCTITFSTECHRQIRTDVSNKIERIHSFFSCRMSIVMTTISKWNNR
jgi:hypothetical protein